MKLSASNLDGTSLSRQKKARHIKLAIAQCPCVAVHATATYKNQSSTSGAAPQSRRWFTCNESSIRPHCVSSDKPQRTARIPEPVFGA